MRAAIFQDAVESSAKVIGRKNVRVVFSGDQACTDGYTVTLPSIPPSHEITVDQADVIRGYRDHESMHVRCTNTSKGTIERLTKMTKSSPLLGSMAQYCEDIRIEHAGVQEYAGMKHTLSATNTRAALGLEEEIIKHGGMADVMAGLDVPKKMQIILQAMGRRKIGVHSHSIYDKMCDAVKAVDPATYDLAERFSDLMVALPTGYKDGKLDEAASKKGTALALNLAQEICDAIDALQQAPAGQPPQPPQSDPGEEQGQGQGQGREQGQEQGDGGDPSTEQGQPGDQSDGKGGNGEQGNGANGQGDGGDEDGGTQGSGDSGGESEGDDKAPGSSDSQGGGGGGSSSTTEQQDGKATRANGGGDHKPEDVKQGGSANASGRGSGGVVMPSDALSQLDDLFKSALNSVVNDISNNDPLKKNRVTKSFCVYSRNFQQVVPIMDAVLAGQNETGSGYRTSAIRRALSIADRMKSEIAGKRAMIRRVLELELQARSDRRWESGYRSGRLQSIRVVDAIQGRDTVYQQRRDGKDMDTLLFISLDGSQSMTRLGRAYNSACLALALSEALERTGCEIIVSMWGNIAVTQSHSSASKYTSADVQRLRKSGGFDEYGRPDCSDNNYVSSGLLTRGRIKDIRQCVSDPVVLAGFGASVESLNCCTPAYHAIFTDLEELSKQRHSKKIYLFLTDGQADNLPRAFSKSALMNEAHQYAASIGVHMIGVGIGGMDVSHLFTDSISVQGSDAYEPVIRKLAKLVAKEAGHEAGFRRAA